MCNILLPASNNATWQLGCTDAGILTTTLTPFTFPINSPLLKAPSKTFALTTNTLGQLVTTQVVSNNFAQQFYVLTSPGGLNYKLTTDNNGILSTTFSAAQLNETIPTPLDITMSNFPSSSGVTCPRCGNAGVTVRGDFSCWCCICQFFVDPNDTTILVFLDE